MAEPGVSSNTYGGLAQDFREFCGRYLQKSVESADYRLVRVVSPRLEIENLQE